MTMRHLTAGQTGAAAIAAALLAKLVLLVLYGPVLPPDAQDYIRFADQILSGRLERVRLGDDLAALSLFRVIGYPALIAGAKTLAGEYWTWLLVGLQNLVSCWAAWEVARLLRTLGLTGAWPAIGAAMFLGSLPLVLDQVILTDSLSGSFIILACLRLARPLLLHRSVRPWQALEAGIFIAAAFLLREATLIIIGPSLLFLALLAALASPAGSAPAKRTIQALTLLALLFGPLLAAQGVYRAWNEGRVGRAIITTGAQSTMFQAIAIAAGKRPAMFSGDRPIDQAVRATFKTYDDFEEIWALNTYLRQQFGMNQADIADLGMQTYFRLWREHPGAMLHIPLHHMRGNIAAGVFQPFASVRLLHIWATGQRSSFAEWRGVREGRWAMAPLALLDIAIKAAAFIVFAAFLLGIPLRLWREGPTRANLVATGFWLLYLGFLSAYALVHLEVRYLHPVIAAPLIFGLSNLAWGWRIFRPEPGSSPAIAEKHDS